MLNMTDAEIVEALNRALEHTAAHPDSYNYLDWPSCAVGEIYRGATGRRGTDDAVTRPGPRSRHAVVIRRVAEVLGYKDEDEDSNVQVITEFVSDMAQPCGERPVTKARRVIRMARNRIAKASS